MVGSLLGAFLAATLALVSAYLIFRPKISGIPIINALPKDVANRKAYAAYMVNARRLVRDGFKYFNSPFRILTPTGSRVIVPPNFVPWVYDNTDDIILSHARFVSHEYLTWVPGFDGVRIVHDPDRIVIDATIANLSNNSKCIGIMHPRLEEALEKLWQEDETWHSVSLGETIIDLLASTLAEVFVGPVLARDSEWLEMNKTYTINVFQGVRALRAWPALLRPIVHWFLKECIICRSQLRLAEHKAGAELARRKAHNQSAISKGSKPVKFDDGLSWINELAEKRGQHFNSAAAQLSFSAASLHTTSELLQQSLIDIATHSELIEPLRNEISTALKQGGGWTTKALAQMQLLDSCIKETQRLKPGALVNLERIAVRDAVMPNGMILQKGTAIAVDSSVMWDPNVHAHPEQYDGYRFLRLRQSTTSKLKCAGNMAQLAATTEDFFAFGLGKPICPGRFFAANNLKFVIANILIAWNIRLKEGTETKIVETGFEMLSNPAAVIEVKKRRKVS